MLCFKLTFPLCFHIHQEALWFLFTFCHKGGVICISEVIDISPGSLDSSLCFIQSSPAFLMMYSAYKLNKQCNNIQPCCTLLNLEPVHFSMSISNCCFLACILVSQEAGKVVWYSHPLKKCSTVCCDPHSQRL